MFCNHLFFLSLSYYGCKHVENVDDSIFTGKILQTDASCEDNLIPENAPQVKFCSCTLRFMGSWSIIIIDRYLFIYLHFFFLLVGGMHLIDNVMVPLGIT